MTFTMVTSALTALLFHLPFVCCAVLSGVEKLYQARRMIGGIGNMLFSTFRLQVITLSGPSHGKQKNDDERMYQTLG